MPFLIHVILGHWSKWEECTHDPQRAGQPSVGLYGTVSMLCTLFFFDFIEDYSSFVIHVSDRDRQNSSMRLDIAFSHPHKNKYLILGLRETSSFVYSPVTFYVCKKGNGHPFPSSKRIKILTIETLQTKPF